MTILHKIIIVLAIIAFAYALVWLDDRWLRRRPKHPKLWLNAFHEEQHKLVNEALDWICFSFGLSQNSRYSLRPSDTIKSIYRRYYSKHALCDNMEYEELYDFLEQNGYDPFILNNEDLTVRDLVTLHAGEPINYGNTPIQ